MYSQDRSNAKVSARASFQICTYLISMGVVAFDTNERRRQEVSGLSVKNYPD